MDSVLQSMNGINFFVSCVTGTTTHGPSSSNENTFLAGISYFISYVKSSVVDQEKIFALFHDNEIDIDISKIKTRSSKKSDSAENLLAQLKQVCKVKYISKC